MRLGPSLGIVYSVGTEGLLRAELVMYRLGGVGGVRAYAAAERRETGKSTDLCSSLDSGSEVSIARKLRLKVQVG